jgi:hypothetical protein
LPLSLNSFRPPRLMKVYQMYVFGIIILHMNIHTI